MRHTSLKRLPLFFAITSIIFTLYCYLPESVKGIRYFPSHTTINSLQNEANDSNPSDNLNSKEKNDESSSKHDFQIYTDVKIFGAKGDGITNDAEAIQKAIDTACKNETRTVLFPPGTYNIGSSQLNLPSWIYLMGVNKKSSKILYTGEDKAIISGERKTSPYGSATYYITIADLTILGTNQKGTCFYITSRYMTMKDTEIRNFNVGIDCEYCWSNKYSNVLFCDINTHIIGGSQFNANSFVNCIFASGEQAFSLKQVLSINFNGCQFENFIDAVFKCEIAANINGFNVTGSYFENRAIMLSVADNCIFTGLNFTGNLVTMPGSNPAFYIKLSDGKIAGSISNNTFFRNNKDSKEPFFNFSGDIHLSLDNNSGFTFPNYLHIDLLKQLDKIKETTN